MLFLSTGNHMPSTAGAVFKSTAKAAILSLNSLVAFSGEKYESTYTILISLFFAVVIILAMVLL